MIFKDETVPHTLELKYGLTAQELLDAIDKRFRLKVALEGAVAEVHFERKLRIASKEGWLNSYENHDMDGMHDFTVVTLDGVELRVEVKTIRNGKKPQVELQKTRAALRPRSFRCGCCLHRTFHWRLESIPLRIGTRTAEPQAAS